MSRTAFCLLCIMSLQAIFGQDARSGDALEPRPLPALPFYDWNQCPGEGCIYRQWIARKADVVYDTCRPNRQPIARLSQGDAVTALTGVVITFRPGVIRMDRDLPDLQLKRGDKILTYTYLGEGSSAVGIKGRYYPGFDISFTKWPDGGGCSDKYCAATYLDVGKKVWWAKVRLKSGQVGWVDLTTADFRGMCALEE